MVFKTVCPGCGRDVVLTDGAEAIKCIYCGSVVSDNETPVKKELAERLGLATGFRRVGRFEDSQRELENILEEYPDSADAMFGCVLNYYEVTDYAFDKTGGIARIKCLSADRRPVEKNRDWQEVRSIKGGAKLSQWAELSKKIEEARAKNISIKQSIPKYRAILLYDYCNSGDADAAHGIYEILSKKTDVFFPPVTLSAVPFEERDVYLMQALKNPEIAPLMFVIYSDAFNFRNKKAQYYGNIAKQCNDFADFHAKHELFSVTCDYEPPAMMKRLSIKCIRCEDFAPESYSAIADAIMDNILDLAYDTDEYYAHIEKGKIVKLNEDKELSPRIEFAGTGGN